MDVIEKLKMSKIFTISCGICKMDCKNCEVESLTIEHNKNVDRLISQDKINQ